MRVHLFCTALAVQGFTPALRGPFANARRGARDACTARATAEDADAAADRTLADAAVADASLDAAVEARLRDFDAEATFLDTVSEGIERHPTMLRAAASRDRAVNSVSRRLDDAAAPILRTDRGDAAVTTLIFRGRIAATSRRRR